MYTWNVKVGDYRINAKAKKADAKRLQNALHRIVRIDLYFRELTGVIGEKEHASVLYTPMGGNEGEVADKEAYIKDLGEFLESLPDPVTDIDGTIKRANEIFERHIPVVDHRLTPEVNQIAKAEAARALADIEAKRLEWVDGNCKSRTKVVVPDGMMVVYLEITYNNSDGMTDYFDMHHQHGEDMLLAIVKKQAQTERLCRSVLDRYPELAAFEYTWHTENYSGGHGNYLMSGAVGTLEGMKTYGGVENPAYCCEVRCSSYDKSMYAYKNYPGTKLPDKSEEDHEGSGYLAGGTRVGDAAVSYDRDWTWVFFPAQPPESIRSKLKAIGGRFGSRRSKHSRSSAWYFTRRVPMGDLEEAILGVDGRENASDTRAPSEVRNEQEEN